MIDWSITATFLQKTDFFRSFIYDDTLLSLPNNALRGTPCDCHHYFRKRTIRTELDFTRIIFGDTIKRYEINFNILNDFMKKYNYKRRPRHMMVERYHNNTHRIKHHLLLLDLLFRTPPNSQSKTSMCRELCYYLYQDHFKDSKCFCTSYSSKLPNGMVSW